MEDQLIGPYVLPNRFTGVGNVLPELIEGVPPQIQNHMWFMHDEALISVESG
jgi:hypothetical protein